MSFNFNFTLKWADALKRKLLGGKLDMETVDGEVFATYDMLEVSLTADRKMSIALLQGNQKIVESSLMPIDQTHGGMGTTIHLSGLHGRVKLLTNGPAA